jgi:hypothetical protein
MTELAHGKRNWPVNFLLAAAAGATIWALSVLITGKREPWDANSLYYFGSLFVVGLIIGFMRPHGIWMIYLGVFIGQLAYMLLFLPLGGLFVLGILFLAACAFISLLGAKLGVIARGLLDKYRPS